MSEREYRSGGHVKVDDPKQGLIEIVPVTYEAVDDYQTIWTRGVFDKSVEKRTPLYCWNHDDGEPLGRMIDAGYRDGDDGPTMIFKLDLEKDERGAPLVPMAARAWSQINSGTLTEHSVGFRRVEWEAEERGSKTVDRFRVCDLDEVSSVMRGAVPGTKTLATRSAVLRGTVDALTALVAAGKISEADALAALAGPDALAALAAKVPEIVPPVLVEDTDPIFADIDAALDSRSFR